MAANSRAAGNGERFRIEIEDARGLAVTITLRCGDVDAQAFVDIIKSRSDGRARVRERLS